MTALSVSRPSADAPNAVVAAWYERKARLHEHLVDLDGRDRIREKACAAKAHARALALLQN